MLGQGPRKLCPGHRHEPVHEFSLAVFACLMFGFLEFCGFEMYRSETFYCLDLILSPRNQSNRNISQWAMAIHFKLNCMFSDHMFSPQHLNFEWKLIVMAHTHDLSLASGGSKLVPHPPLIPSACGERWVVVLHGFVLHWGSDRAHKRYEQCGNNYVCCSFLQSREK